MPGYTGTAARQIAQRAEIHLDHETVVTSCPICGRTLTFAIGDPGYTRPAVERAAQRLRRDVVHHLTLDGCRPPAPKPQAERSPYARYKQRGRQPRQ